MNKEVDFIGLKFLFANTLFTKKMAKSLSVITWVDGKASEWNSASG